MKLSDLDNWTTEPVCFLCHRRAAHKHHKIYRSRGGSDDSGNLVLLCIMCHNAVHGIRSVIDGQTCKDCPVFERCYFGQVVEKQIPTVPEPWVSRSRGRTYVPPSED